MAYIKLMREDEGKVYFDELALQDLILYVFQFNKTYEDGFRINMHYNADYVGCEPWLFLENSKENPASVFLLFKTLSDCYEDKGIGLVQHRIISFESTDIILPGEITQLAKKIIGFYANLGLIAAYGVHRNTANLHIHVIVSSISINGQKMNILNEKSILSELVEEWIQKLNLNSEEVDRRSKILYGDGVCGYGQVELSAVEQMKQNKKRLSQKKRKFTTT